MITTTPTHTHSNTNANTNTTTNDNADTYIILQHTIPYYTRTAPPLTPPSRTVRLMPPSQVRYTILYHYYTIPYYTIPAHSVKETRACQRWKG